MYFLVGLVGIFAILSSSLKGSWVESAEDGVVSLNDDSKNYLSFILIIIFLA